MIIKLIKMIIKFKEVSCIKPELLAFKLIFDANKVILVIIF